MIRGMKHATLATALLAGTATGVLAEPLFNRIASFPVASNLPEGSEPKTSTSAEIVTASADGLTLVYSDSPLGAIGFIDITDARAPKALGVLSMDGEPTSVASHGTKVLAAVNTSQSKASPSGKLVTVDIATRKPELSCDLGGSPIWWRSQRMEALPPSRSKTSATRISTTAICRSCLRAIWS